jgi:hypothetical protein
MRFVFKVRLLLHLFEEYWVIVSLIIDHSSLWLQVRSSVPLILTGAIVRQVVSSEGTNDNTGEESVSSEEFSISSRWINVWPIVNPSLIWGD